MTMLHRWDGMTDQPPAKPGEYVYYDFGWTGDRIQLWHMRDEGLVWVGVMTHAQLDQIVQARQWRKQ